MEINALIAYGLPVLIMSACVVTGVGLIKTFLKAQFGSKVNWLKAAYQSAGMLLSIAAVCIYYLVSGLSLFCDYTFYITCCSTAGASQVLYSIYENYGLRKLIGVFSTCLFQIFHTEVTKRVDNRHDTIPLAESGKNKVVGISEP